MDLARALGKKSNASVSRWLTNKRVFSPREFSNFVNAVKPDEKELDVLAELYSEQIIKGRGVGGKRRLKGNVDAGTSESLA